TSYRIHPNIVVKKKGLPSTQFQFPLALPPGMHGRLKEEGCYPLTSSLDRSSDCEGMMEVIWTEEGREGVLRSPTRVTLLTAVAKSLLVEELVPLESWVINPFSKQ
ncbi:hypothetical protein O181_062720, partial [Austropuccinia psidii MF-1]|nr:hypothetical protein [Austropuccinia psidii MF-1]